MPAEVGDAMPPLCEATLDDLNTALVNGTITSVGLVKAYLARIEGTKSAVNAVTETNPDALAIAAACDDERAKGALRGYVRELYNLKPLHGIPILIKNNIATCDKMNNTAGSMLLVGAKVPRDATVAKKLRDAGAILLGKTNLTQWANYRSRRGELHMDGWSAHGGQTYGAYHDKQSPSGSSSGSGVAADLGLAFAALGTETDGSIVFPCERNNIVGIKPTVGLASRDLVIPICEHHDTVGPMARTVRDAAAVLQVIAGRDDANDKYTAAIPTTVPDYLAACDAGALNGARIGVPWKAIHVIKEGGIAFEIATFREALKTLQGAGATIVDADYDADISDIKVVERKMFAADFPVNIAHYLSQLSVNPSGVNNIHDMMAMTRAHPDESYPARNTATWEQALEQGWDNTDTEHFPALLRDYEELCEKRGLPGTMAKHRLDAVVMPTSGSAIWPAVAAAPAVTVPLGFHPADAEVCWNKKGTLVEVGPGVPFGICFMGRKWEEERLIGLAYGFEQRTNVRKAGVRVVSVPKAE